MISLFKNNYLWSKSLTKKGKGRNRREGYDDEKNKEKQEEIKIDGSVSITNLEYSATVLRELCDKRPHTRDV